MQATFQFEGRIFTLTTEHSASSYGIPVLIVDGLLYTEVQILLGGKPWPRAEEDRELWSVGGHDFIQCFERPDGTHYIVSNGVFIDQSDERFSELEREACGEGASE